MNLKGCLFTQDSVFDKSFNNDEYISTVIDNLVSPVKKSNYICDKKFHINYAQKLIKNDEESKRKYGILMIFGEETVFYIYQSGNINKIKKITVRRSKNQKAGGQSAPRFQRQRLNQINEYVKNICEECKNIYIKNGVVDIDGLFIAGAGEIKDKVKVSQDLHSNLRKYILKVHPTNQNNVINILPIAEKYFKNTLQKEHIILMNEFLEHVNNDTDMAIYGKKCIEKYMKLGAIKYLLIQKDKFSKMEKIKKTAEKYNTDTHEIFNETLEDYGGVVGILRYKDKTTI